MQGVWGFRHASGATYGAVHVNVHLSKGGTKMLPGWRAWHAGNRPHMERRCARTAVAALNPETFRGRIISLGPCLQPQALHFRSIQHAV